MRMSAYLSRRNFLRLAGSWSLGAVGAFGYTWRFEPHWVEVVRTRLSVRHLPEGLFGKTLVQISDLHVGKIVDDAHLVKTLKRVSSLKADLLVITGDFMTCHGLEEVDHVMRVLEHLGLGRLGTAAVMGNHDYGRNWSRPDAANALTRRLEMRGIDVLRNGRAAYGGLTVVGLDDLWSPNFQPQRVMGQIGEEEATIVLCHNPDAADERVWSGYQGWILCGHTHGGQCSVPGWGPPILPVRNKRYSSGLIDLGDGRRMYINRGLGYMHRVRFNVRPEITVFTLERDDGAKPREA
jgi:hypothetical protein